MIANFGPADYNYDETITTLRWVSSSLSIFILHSELNLFKRYASRAKNIKNAPKINEDPKVNEK